MAKVDDVRLSVDIFDNPKIRKLIRHKGEKGFLMLMKLWIWTARNRPKGILSDLEPEDLMDIIQTNDETFVDYLVDIDLLEYYDSEYIIHDWKSNQPWSFYTEDRSKKAQKAAEIRWLKTKKSSSEKS